MRGYLEGYYGRLLDWSARVTVLDALAEHGLDTYAYAPKEDARHRLRWRDPYDAAWRSDFAAFCRAARARGVSVIAGVAPGIDFDFASLAGGADLEATVDKLARLRDDGASRLMLLLDDIDPDFARRDGGIASEGEAHARLANRLGERLDAALVVVPRIYAGELADAAPGYLDDFAVTLDARHAISVCGRDVVAREVGVADCRLPGDIADRETIVWDNLYANDYCPRRLFVGPWQGRAGIDRLQPAEHLGGQLRQRHEPGQQRTHGQQHEDHCAGHRALLGDAQHVADLRVVISNQYAAHWLAPLISLNLWRRRALR